MLGTDSLPPHVPRPSVPTLPSPLRHEMLRHILYPRRRQIRRDILRPPSLRRQHVHVEIPRHHQVRARWLSSYLRDQRLHGHFVLEGNVCPDDVPASLPCCHLKYHHIRPAPLHRLHHEVGCGAVKKCYAAAVSDRRIRCDDFVAGRPAGVDAICGFVSWRMSGSILAWDIPRSAASNPPFRPLRML